MFRRHQSPSPVLIGGLIALEKDSAGPPASPVTAARMIGPKGRTALVRAGSPTRASQWYARIPLLFIRSYVATELVFRIGTWLATLVALQQIAFAIGAAAGVACVNRWAFRRGNSHGLCRAAVVLQGTQHGVNVVPIAAVAEIAVPSLLRL
jgi:hypothetical protein